jgi:RNA polymerase sigma-70 factor (ECF subfamily)
VRAPGDDRESAAALGAALSAERHTEARRLVAGVVDDREARDEVLEVLAASGRDGDPVATELLVELIDRSGLVRAAARRVLVDESAVDEVAQDTLVVVATRLHGFRGEARFSTWLHGIARNRAVDHLRARRDDAPAVEERPARRISSIIASRAAVDQLLARLPDHYRHAVTLRDVEQLPYADVATRLGCPESTARTRVDRGRALVATMLGDDRELGR